MAREISEQKNLHTSSLDVEDTTVTGEVVGVFRHIKNMVLCDVVTTSGIFIGFLNRKKILPTIILVLSTLLLV